MKLDSKPSVENEYSQEPETSKSTHEYETLQEMPSSSTAIADGANSSIATQPQESNIRSNEISNNSVLATKLDSRNIVYENVGEKKTPLSSGIESSVKVYGRSMYSNLNRSEVEVERKDLSSFSTVRDPSSLQTSTPIKSGGHSSSVAVYV